MEKRHKKILIDMREGLVSDVDTENIINKLISAGTVEIEFDEKLSQEKESRKRMRELLDYLPRRGPNAYQTFKNSLKTNYKWLFDEMEAKEQQDLNSSDELDASLIEQNFPQPWLPSIPPLNVTRKQKMNQLRDGLEKLKPKCYLALHALQGWGKSTLVCETLINDKLRIDYFENEVYWVKFGQYDSDSCDELSNDILNQLNLLFHKVRNLDHLSEPTNEDSLKYSLKKYFSTHTNALIILDHANKREIIEAFDFGSKTLVLTTDMGVLEGKQYTEINMKDGFTVEESLELFADALYPNEKNHNIASLPKQARLIHEECKGMPLMISMYAAHFSDIKENLIDDKDGTKVWSHYLDDLRKKSRLLPESWKKLSDTFDMCIKNLSESDKKFYQIFSIFPEDVNITTETLSIACNMTSSEVDSTMVKFQKKSLAVKQWHEGLKTYIYGIHDLMLRHLRKGLTQKELIDRHRSYINKNLAICNGDYSKLPRDNYIYSYIGYHLKEGELFEKFSEIYLDFDFIQSKIYENGPGNLLIDLKKYRKYISGNSIEIASKVEDLKQFLIQQASTLAEYRTRNCLDIVQIALNHPNPGFVRNTAEILANKTPQGLYFKYNKQSTKNSNPTDVLQMKICSVAFTNEPVMILVGTENGKVVWWNCRNRRHLFFYGNKADSPVKKIVFSKESKFFISLSESGIAKLFDLKEPFEKHHESYANTEQWTRQTSYQSLHGAPRNHDESRMTIEINGQKITDVAVSSDGEKIATCTYAGYVTVRNIHGELLVDCPSALSKPSIVGITFMTNNNMLYLANENTKSMITLDASNGNYITQSSLYSGNETLKSLLPVQGYSNFLIALLDKKLLTVSWPIGQEPYGSPMKKSFGELDNGISCVYTSAAVTRDGEYVVTADTSGSVNVYKIRDEPMIIRTYKKSVISLDTWQFDEDVDGRHTICGCSDDAIVPLVYRWKFDPEEKPERTPLFDATMKTGSNDTMMIAVSTVNGTIKMIQNETEVIESDALNTRITSLKIFSNGDRVVYATENCFVYIFDVKHSKTTDILKLSEPAHFITVLNVYNEDLIICQNGNNDLQFWISESNNRLVENSGTVIFSKILEKIGYIITVSNTAIKFWDQSRWDLKCKHEFASTLNIKYCSLSTGDNLLAVANPQGIIQVFKLVPIQVTPNIKTHQFHVKKLEKEITACCFSSDETMLAVGLKTGSIIIMEMETFTEQRRFEFHSKPIKQLYWSPSNINEPILLSLSNELAWWLVPHIIKKEVVKKSTAKCLGISLSKSEQNITSKAKEFIDIDGNGDNNKTEKIKHSTSLDLDSDLSEMNENAVASSSMNSSLLDISLEDDSGINESSTIINSSVNGIWEGKRKGIHQKIDGLLNLIKLDGNSAMKVCFSSEFNHFITIDGEGSIYNLTVFEEKLNDVYNSSPS